MNRLHLFTVMIGLLLAATIWISGCENAPIETHTADNPNFNVEKLFTQDNCVMYRFLDGASTHYFMTCHENIGVSETHSCGKGCTREDWIRTE